MIHRDLKKKFKSLFGKDPFLVRAPGRINLIGEHTDYNEGFVLPAAINKHIVFAVQENHHDVHRFTAEDLDENLEVAVDNIKPHKKHWANYLLGVIAQLNKKGFCIPGVDCLFGGDIPIGAGLSSSAAMETGFLFALNEIFTLGLDRLEMARMAQMAEHEYAGVKCGIMDQFASMFGRKNKVIRLDCKTLEHDLFSMELPEHDMVLCDTRVSHSLASSAYNRRREECRAGVEILKKHDSAIESLRDVSPEFLSAFEKEFDPVVFRHCRFVVEEIYRLHEACESLKRGDLEHFGALMYQTHSGLRDEYEVSCRELDILVDLAVENNVAGSRMMGGGFGGCTINLLKKKHTREFIDAVSRRYQLQTGIEPGIYRVSIEKGTEIIEDV